MTLDEVQKFKMNCKDRETVEALKFLFREISGLAKLEHENFMQISKLQKENEELRGIVRKIHKWKEPKEGGYEGMRAGYYFLCEIQKELEGKYE